MRIDERLGKRWNSPEEFDEAMQLLKEYLKTQEKERSFKNDQDSLEALPTKGKALLENVTIDPLKTSGLKQAKNQTKPDRQNYSTG